MRCFIDLDGVLVEFVRGMVKAHGLPSDPYDDPKWAGEYLLTKVLGIPKLHTLWKPATHKFWAELEPSPECPSILAICERIFGADNIWLLTSPSLNTGSASGKMTWIYNNLPKHYHRRFMIGPGKELCADANSVLIDDSDDVLGRFVAAGGHGVLYPRPWNSRHSEADRRVEVMTEELEQLAGELVGGSNESLAS